MSEHVHYTIRHAVDPAAAARVSSAELREHFLIGGLFEPGRLNLTYTHYDRLIVGGAMPTQRALLLDAIRPTGTEKFLERRELIAVNIGGDGNIFVDSDPHALTARDMLYVGMASDVSFASNTPANPAKFYLLSAPAHQKYPTPFSALAMRGAWTSAMSRLPTSALFFSSSTRRVRGLASSSSALRSLRPARSGTRCRRTCMTGVRRSTSISTCRRRRAFST
jgi:hypothetical protein